MLAAYFWSFVQGLRALTRFSTTDDSKFSNVYLSVGVAPLLLLAGIHSLSSASWLIGGFFYPVMPLLAMGIYSLVLKGLNELAKTDGKALTQRKEAPNAEVPECCSAACSVVSIKCADPECFSAPCTQCSELCKKCSVRCQSFSLRCYEIWLQLTMCFMTCFNGLSACLQACWSPFQRCLECFEKIPGCQGIAGLPKLVVEGLRRGMLGWLAQSTDLPLMRFEHCFYCFYSLVNWRLTPRSSVCLVTGSQPSQRSASC